MLVHNFTHVMRLEYFEAKEYRAQPKSHLIQCRVVLAMRPSHHNRYNAPGTGYMYL